MKNKTTEIIDRAGAKRSYTDEGFLIVPARIARTGIQEYRAYEMGITDGDPMRIIRVYRPPEEVFAPEAMASFENKPITDDHPDEFVTSKNARDLQRGFMRDVQRDGDYLAALLIATDQEAIDKIDAGKVELSNGYDAVYDWTPGVTPDGQPYDAKQTNIRGNHVAIVDAARCGPACRVSDSKPTPKGNTMADRKVTIDGIPFDLPEAAAAAVDKINSQLTAAQDASKKAGEALAAANATHDAAIKAKDAEIAALKKDVMTPEARDAMVGQWAKLMDDAKRIAPDVVTAGKTCDAVRREVIAKAMTDAKQKPVMDALLAGSTLEAASGEQVKTMFAVLAASAPAESTEQRDTATDPAAAALAAAAKNQGGEKVVDDKGGEVLVGRDAMLARFASMSA